MEQAKEENAKKKQTNDEKYYISDKQEEQHSMGVQYGEEERHVHFEIEPKYLYYEPEYLQHKPKFLHKHEDNHLLADEEEHNQNLEKERIFIINNPQYNLDQLKEIYGHTPLYIE